EKRGITKIDQLFRGETPGLLAAELGSAAYTTAVNGFTRPGYKAQSTGYSRGSADLSGGANPIKTFIDGVELVDPSYLGTIDLKNIERIEILTGPQAATVYGSGAMGGVMQIFTKRGSTAGKPVDIVLGLKYGMWENSA